MVVCPDQKNTDILPKFELGPHSEFMGGTKSVYFIVFLCVFYWFHPILHSELVDKTQKKQHNSDVREPGPSLKDQWPQLCAHTTGAVQWLKSWQAFRYI